MRKWQILEFDGKPYYAFVPEDDEPLKMDDLPEYPDNVTFTYEDPQQAMSGDEAVVQEEAERVEVEATAEIAEEEDQEENEYYEMLEDEPEEASDVKPVIINGKVETQVMSKPEPESPSVEFENSSGDLYQVKVEGGMFMLEKVDANGSEQPSTEVTAVVESGSKDESVEVLNDDNFQDLDDENEDEPAEVIIEESMSDGKKSGPLKCKACSGSFESRLAFRKHVAWTHKRKVCLQENGEFICSVCDFRTGKKSQFAAHLQRKHETWSRKRQSSAATFPCAACGFVCRSKHSLQSHFIRKHTDKYEHQCKFCPKKFKVKGDLTNHVRFHHKEKPVSCDVCGKLCLNSGSLYVHQKWAHFKPKFECPICKRRMVTQENLDQHMLMQHEKREKIVCAECGKTFTKKDSFKRHMAVHSGSKPYNCVICNKPFARRSQLRQHLLIHTGKRPFVCDICGKAFTQKPGLICHRKTHPGSHPPLPVMPIGDIVKEFTDGLKNPAKNKAGVKVEEEEEEEDDDDDDEFGEEEYEEEEIEEEMIEEEVLLEEEIGEEDMII